MLLSGDRTGPLCPVDKTRGQPSTGEQHVSDSVTGCGSEGNQRSDVLLAISDM